MVGELAVLLAVLLAESLAVSLAASTFGAVGGPVAAVCMVSPGCRGRIAGCVISRRLDDPGGLAQWLASVA
jgi:hypothetical protein